MKKLHAGDPVIVIAGKHKGKISTIDKIDENIVNSKGVKKINVYVKGVNEAKKAQKGQWFITKILPLDISNVMYYNEKDKTASRIGISVDKKTGKKSRMIKKTKTVIKK